MDNTLSKLPKDVLGLILDSEDNKFDKAYAALTNDLLMQNYEESIHKGIYWQNLLEKQFALQIPLKFQNDVLCLSQILQLLKGLFSRYEPDYIYDKDTPDRVSHLFEIFAEDFEDDTSLIVKRMDIDFILLVKFVEILVYNLPKSLVELSPTNYYHFHALNFLILMFLRLIKYNELSIGFWLLLKEKVGFHLDTMTTCQKGITMDKLAGNIYTTIFAIKIQKYLQDGKSLEELSVFGDTMTQTFGDFLDGNIRQCERKTYKEEEIERHANIFERYPRMIEVYVWNFDMVLQKRKNQRKRKVP